MLERPVGLCARTLHKGIGGDTWMGSMDLSEG